MMLFLVILLAVLVAPPPSLCMTMIMAVNMTLFQERRESHEHDSPLTLLRGIESSNLTCSEAQLIARSCRTRGMVFIKDKASFDFPGYALCLADIDDDFGSLYERC